MNEKNKKIIYAVIFKSCVFRSKESGQILHRSSAKKYNVYGFTDSLDKVSDLIRSYYARKNECDREYRELYPHVSSGTISSNIESIMFYNKNDIRVRITSTGQSGPHRSIDIILNLKCIEFELDEPFYFDYWKSASINKSLGTHKYVDRSMTYEA